jgi:hypothetical protein
MSVDKECNHHCGTYRRISEAGEYCKHCDKQIRYTTITLSEMEISALVARIVDGANGDYLTSAFQKIKEAL